MAKPKIDPLAIPKFLLVKNRKPLTEAQHAALVVKRIEQPPPLSFSLNRPRVLDPEGEAMLAALNAPKKTGPKPTPTRQPSTPRPSRDGLTSIADLAREFDMIPRVARGILRAAAFPKPDVGWAFNAAECDAVRALLKAGPSPSDKPTGVKAKRVTKRHKASRVPTNGGKDGTVVFTGKAIVKRPPPPTLAIHRNIIEAKAASRIKEIAPCPSPKKSSSKSPRTSKLSRSKGITSPPSKRRSKSPSKSSKRTTKKRAARRS